MLGAALPLDPKPLPSSFASQGELRRRVRAPAELTSTPRTPVPRASSRAPSCSQSSQAPRRWKQPFSIPACFFPCAVTGYPLPQQHDPTINKSFLDPPLPRAPSGTLAAAAATNPFQKGGVAAARGSAARVLGLNRGGARPLSPGRRERCERALGAHWPRRATLPGLDWALARRGVASPALVLIGLWALG